MTRSRILAVDDEIVNLTIIEEFLAGAGYELTLVTSAEQAWSRLEVAPATYDVVILDRMMPGMNGIDLLKKLKADIRFREIPVIMQTAASSPEQVREGIEAGAYYYLTKPYEIGILLAIVRAALSERALRAEANRLVQARVNTMELLDSAAFHFRTLAQVGGLIEVLAGLCPVPQRAATGLTELMINAVEHGNLGIGYEDKKHLRLSNTWEAEVARRQALPDYCRRSVRVGFTRHPDAIEFTVTDEGDGFDWHRYLDFDPARATDPNGRGIALARLISFTTLQYTGCGNTAVATIRTAD